MAAKSTVKITAEQKTELDAIQKAALKIIALNTGANWEDLNENKEFPYHAAIGYLLSLHNNKEEFMNGKGKAERTLKEIIHLGHVQMKGGRKLTAAVLKDIAGVNYNTCKGICEVYAKEIETYNNSL